jgi:hypothetical protein
MPRIKRRMYKYITECRKCFTHKFYLFHKDKGILLGKIYAWADYLHFIIFNGCKQTETDMQMDVRIDQPG